MQKFYEIKILLNKKYKKNNNNKFKPINQVLAEVNVVLNVHLIVFGLALDLNLKNLSKKLIIHNIRFKG